MIDLPYKAYPQPPIRDGSMIPVYGTEEHEGGCIYANCEGAHFYIIDWFDDRHRLDEDARLLETYTPDYRVYYYRQGGNGPFIYPGPNLERIELEEV